MPSPGSGLHADHERGQRDDMVILAHIREQHRLSLESYGRPGMTEELQKLGLKMGHRRVGYTLPSSLTCILGASSAPSRDISAQYPAGQ